MAVGGHQEKDFNMYNYSDYTSWLGTVEAQRELIKLLNWVKNAFTTTGAFTEGKARR